MADKDDLVESAKIHSSAQHAHVLLAIDSIQSSHGFVPEQSLVTNAFALPHVVDGDAQVDGFVDQHRNELSPSHAEVVNGGIESVHIGTMGTESQAIAVIQQFIEKRNEQ